MSDIAHTLARLAQQKAIKARRRRVQRQIQQAQQQAQQHAQAQPPKVAAPVLSATQQQGHHAETRALAHLQQAGLVLLARNLSCLAGEIDLVCRDGQTLVFVEVRERHASRFGGAATSIHTAKQQRLIRAAQYWLPDLCQRHFQGRRPVCRFDAVVLDVHGDDDGDDAKQAHIQWIRHAFTSPA